MCIVRGDGFRSRGGKPCVIDIRGILRAEQTHTSKQISVGTPVHQRKMSRYSYKARLGDCCPLDVLTITVTCIRGSGLSRVVRLYFVKKTSFEKGKLGNKAPRGGIC